MISPKECLDARSCPIRFFDAVAEFDGKPSPAPPHARALLKVMEWAYRNREHIVIASPPGTVKSTIARYFFAWCIGNNPSLRTVVVTNRQDTTTDSVSWVRNFILSSKYRLIFPKVKMDNTKDRKAQSDELGEELASQGFRQDKFFLLHKDKAVIDPSMQTLPFEMKAANVRVDLGLFDDIETGNKTHTVESRKKTEKNLRLVWLDGRLVDAKGKGAAIILSNCWHEDDMIHRLKKSGVPSLWMPVAESLTHFNLQFHNFDDDKLIEEVNKTINEV